ncbi:anaerobic ribonucleoside-triphosphate reductase activating protein [Alkaliphilus crotonatoxidans]
MNMRIAGIAGESIVDGPGIRLVVFAQGCRHRCGGCHNPQTHSFTGGYEVTIEEVIEKVRQNPLLDGLTLSGGDPFEQALAFGGLAGAVKDLGLNVVTYTGYTMEVLLSQRHRRRGWNELLNNTDLLVDGKFEADQIRADLRFIGSANQRIINVKESLVKGRIVPANLI